MAGRAYRGIPSLMFDPVEGLRAVEKENLDPSGDSIGDADAVFGTPGVEDVKDTQERMRGWLKAQPLVVFRALLLPLGGTTPTTQAILRVLRTDGVGEFWAWSIGGADTYGGREGDRKVILRAEVDPGSVNWGRTLVLNVYANNEFECRLLPGAPIRLTGWTEAWNAPVRRLSRAVQMLAGIGRRPRAVCRRPDGRFRRCR